MRKLSLILFSIIAACGDDTAPVFDAAVDSATADEEGPFDDGNDNFDEAKPVPTAGIEGVIDQPGDHDFFEFTADEGDWVAIFTEANPMGSANLIDTVIKIYDEGMTMIAENDDAQPRVNTDSEVIMRLPSSGTFYIEVIEYGEWISDDDEFPAGNSNFDYELFAVIVEADDFDAVVEDPETGDDVASATPLEFSDTARSLVFGRLDDTSDADVFSFTAPGKNNTFTADVMPAGVNGYGSTSTAGRIRITDATGVTTVAQIDNAEGIDEIQPPLVAGVNYLLWVEFPEGGSAGNNDFYVIKFNWAGDNPPEPLGVNDTAATASPLDMVPDPAPSDFRRGFVLATLTPAATDVDYFSFDVQAGELVSVACGSASLGSGLQNVRAEIRNASDTVVESEVEGSNPDPTVTGIFIDSATVPVGTAYLRLSATAQGSVTSNFVRCGVHAGPPP